ncbi:heparan-alpha-glucosaminide N-acetyltransferase isoform X1 [Pygocentrus nattereri]|uniref:Heparan-alpha-glucosaminide N-acetyltransferase catalytic domain-containing protein n=1 Tax=Pygocentrus nattereri TaxID=42514 RepID=A0A3B4EF62_PYGNA|nr:heparan-alpha-glucosaminide N-acetyltransferase isoform X1 [Pygocentrus nattereri]
MRKGQIQTSGEEKREEGVAADDMAPKKHQGLIFIAVIVAFLALCVAPLTAELPSSRPRRKTAALKMDEAALYVINEVESEMLLSIMSDHCFQCFPQPVGRIPAGPGPGVPATLGFTVSTQHALILQLNSTPLNTELCRMHFHFGEHGNYSLWVKNLNDLSQVNCTMVTDSEPINSYLPILLAFLVFASLYVLAAIWNSVKGLDAVRNLLLRLGSTMEAERLINSELGSPSRVVESSAESIIPATAGRRLRSLDTFRGLALVVMVFVNYGGGRYWFFRHESWNGLTVADLVFPWFVFIMGTSISLSVNGALCRGAMRSHLLRKVCWRSLQLFLIGVFIINPNYCLGPLSWDSLRIPGVLQRLAFTYLVVAVLDVLVARVHQDSSLTDVWWYPAHDIFLNWPAWICVITMETLWLCLTFLLPVPGCPTGYLGPGGVGDFGQYPDCTGGAAGYIDRWLLGENHIYQTPSTRVVYQTTVPFDPEGVLGSINSVLMAFLGLQAGKVLLHYREQHRQIITRFLVWSFLLGIFSAVLTKCSRNQGYIPVNKNLWSLSYVTTLSCFAFVVLLVVYYTVDVKRWWSGAPFFYPGMNSILVYVGHEVFEDYFPFRWRMANSQSHSEHLAQNLLATSIWVLISYVLYRKKIFWKI